MHFLIRADRSVLLPILWPANISTEENESCTRHRHTYGNCGPTVAPYLASCAKVHFFALCREVAMTVGAFDCVMRPIATGKPTHQRTSICASRSPLWRRKCGPSNPRLPIPSIKPNRVTIALATLVLLVSGELIDRARAQSVCTVAGILPSRWTGGSWQDPLPYNDLNGTPRRPLRPPNAQITHQQPSISTLQRR